MILEGITLKVSDLPKELVVEIPDGASDSEVERVKESLRSQVAYNSRIEDQEDSVPEIKVIELERKTNTVKLRLEK